MEKPLHVPVLFDDVLEYLKVRPGGTYVDATLGLGGHSAAIARRLGGTGKLICFDRDPEAMAQGEGPAGRDCERSWEQEMPEVIYEAEAVLGGEGSDRKGQPRSQAGRAACGLWCKQPAAG